MDLNTREESPPFPIPPNLKDRDADGMVTRFKDAMGAMGSGVSALTHLHIYLS